MELFQLPVVKASISRYLFRGLANVLADSALNPVCYTTACHGAGAVVQCLECEKLPCIGLRERELIEALRSLSQCGSASNDLIVTLYRGRKTVESQEG